MIKEHDFNKILARKIKPGYEFKNLIPAAQQSEIIFEKSQKEILESDVFDTLEHMAHWATKYAYQMEKVAPLLKGATTAQTVRNIFDFLYWHFQYKLDDAFGPQNLHSPARAYANRFTGFDCKTFSVLASTILQCLKMPHSFRMVKQTGLRSKVDPSKWVIDPNNWSHVYVIVHEGNSYHVIDATTHDNKEVKIRVKNDYPMLHRGLNSPVIESLGCACQGNATTTTGLGNPQTLGFAITNFHNYLNALEKQGISRDVTNRMLGLVKYNVERGIDPNMDEILKKAISNSGSLGLNLSSVVSGGVQSASNNIKVGGSSISQIGGAIAGDPASIMAVAKNLLGKLMPTNFINSTFGAVFANGFDTSCWGASLTPQTAQENIAKFHNKHFSFLLTSIGNATTLETQQAAINLFIKDVYSLHKYYTVYKPKAASWSGCGKKGIAIYVKYMESLKLQADNFVTQLQGEGAEVNITTLTPLKFFFTPTTTGASKEETKNNPSSSTVDFPQIDLAKIKVASTGTSSSGTKAPKQVVKGVSFTPISGVKANIGGNNNKSEPEKKGINPLLLLSAAGIVLKLVL